MYKQYHFVTYTMYVDKSKVNSVLTKAVRELHDPSSLPRDFILKVCGRDEYLEW